MSEQTTSCTTEKATTAASLNPLAEEAIENAVLDETYYNRLKKELSTFEQQSGMEGTRSQSRMYTEEDLDFCDEEDEDDYDDAKDLMEDVQVDKAERVAEQFENNRAGAWKRKTGPKPRGARVQEYLEKIREATAALNAISAAAAPSRSSFVPTIGGGGGGSSFVPPPPASKFRSSLASSFDPKRVLDICETYDEELNRLLNNNKNGSLLMAKIPSVAPQNQDILVAAYDHMIENLYTDKYRSLFGSYGDDDLLEIRFGQGVPSYFANVGGESIFRRKMLSILGLRNLIQYGPQIFTDLRKKLFAGNTSSYSGSEGLNLMRTVTGNLVDLDSVVLRLSDRQTMDAVNMMNKHKGLPTYSTISQFAASSEATEIAVNCAKSALQDFIDLFKLNESAARSRKVHPDDINSKSIPVATNNSDRGLYPLWRYCNAGQDSFHANVPNIDDVIGGLLKAPFHAIKHYAFTALQSSSSSSSKKFDIPENKLTRYFNEALSDACFNGKWKAIESYGLAVAHEGTIVDQLQKLQMENQSIFTQEFFGSDDENSTKEKQKMFELVSSNNLVGKEKATGKIRAITQNDVDRWVADPSITI